MSSKRKSSRSNSAIHQLIGLVDAWTVWITRNVAEPGTRAPALARARKRGGMRSRGPVFEVR